MAIDTLAKRNSTLSVSTMVLPIPDAGITQQDRQTLLKMYGYVLAIAGSMLGRVNDRISLRLGHLGL